MVVHTGDLIHADEHGSVVIPQSIARDVVTAAKEIECAERVMIALCQSDTFSIPQLDKLIFPGVLEYLLGRRAFTHNHLPDRVGFLFSHVIY
jgi:hypothetical protein